MNVSEGASIYVYTLIEQFLLLPHPPKKTKNPSYFVKISRSRDKEQLEKMWRDRRSAWWWWRENKNRYSNHLSPPPSPFFKKSFYFSTYFQHSNSSSSSSLGPSRSGSFLPFPFLSFPFLYEFRDMYVRAWVWNQTDPRIKSNQTFYFHSVLNLWSGMRMSGWLID